MVVFIWHRGGGQGDQVRLQHQFLPQCRFGHPYLQPVITFFGLNLRFVRLMVPDEHHTLVRRISIGIFHKTVGSHIPVQHINFHFRVDLF